MKSLYICAYSRSSHYSVSQPPYPRVSVDSFIQKSFYLFLLHKYIFLLTTQLGFFKGFLPFTCMFLFLLLLLLFFIFGWQTSFFNVASFRLSLSLDATSLLSLCCILVVDETLYLFFLQFFLSVKKTHLSIIIPKKKQEK